MHEIIPYIEKVEDHQLSLAEAVENYFNDKGVYYNEFKRIQIDPASFEVIDPNFIEDLLLKRNQNCDEKEILELHDDLIDISSKITASVMQVLRSIDTQSIGLPIERKVSEVTRNNFFHILLISEVADKDHVIDFLYLLKNNFDNFVVLQSYIKLTFISNFENKFEVLHQTSLEFDQDMLFSLKPFLIDFNSTLSLQIAVAFLEVFNDYNPHKALKKIYTFFNENRSKSASFEYFYKNLIEIDVSNWEKLFDTLNSLPKGFEFRVNVDCVFKYFKTDSELIYLESFQSLLINKGPFYPSAIIDLYKRKNDDLGKIFADFDNSSVFISVCKLLHRSLQF
ncbi:hypothetical protein HOL52_02205 [bacterium]|nr:hypothetical protein [bacterium]